jgi:hypothetical protein
MRCSRVSMDEWQDEVREREVVIMYLFDRLKEFQGV